MLTFLIALILLLGGALVIFFSLNWLTRDELEPRLKNFVTAQNEPEKRWNDSLTLRSRELSGSVLNRLFLPAFRKTGQLFGRLTPARSVENLQRELYIAGTPLGLGPREFYGLRLAFSLLGVWLAITLIRASSSRLYIMLSLLVLGLCVIFPTLWLRMMVTSRKNKLRKGLPDALDMLSVCVEAGLGFDQSLQRVSEHWKTPIALELGRVVTEMEMGISRREALRNLADRLDVTELSSFVAVILQSEKLGMSIADTLHVQAEQMRIERHFRAQEQARTIPVKMLVPLAFFIFPAILAVLLAPSIPALLDMFKNF